MTEPICELCGYPVPWGGCNCREERKPYSSNDLVERQVVDAIVRWLRAEYNETSIHSPTGVYWTNYIADRILRGDWKRPEGGYWDK